MCRLETGLGLRLVLGLVLGYIGQFASVISVEEFVFTARQHSLLC